MTTKRKPVASVGEPDFDTLRAALRAWRDRRGLNQYEVSVRAGVHDTYYGQIERGRRLCGLAVLRRLAAVLDLSEAERHLAERLLARAKLEQLAPELGTALDHPGWTTPRRRLPGRGDADGQRR